MTARFIGITPMKHLLSTLALCCVAILVISCGPNKAELRRELLVIEGEMTQLNMTAYSLKSQMSRAEWQSFLGGFAATYGAFGGDGQLALQGAGTALEAVDNYDRANYSMKQIQARWNTLSARREEILKHLR